MSTSRHVCRLLAAAAVLLAVSMAAAAKGDNDKPHKPGSRLDLRRQQPITGDPQAGKAASTVCAACHGPRGLSVAPDFPDLAGQSATYLYVQLKSFKGGQRRNAIMKGMVAPLDDAEMRNLAAYYASLPPRPAGRPAADSPGGQLYLHGDPARGIPPCQGCHGPAGGGPRVYPDGAPHPPWSTFPRLHGQPATYVAKALHDFRSGTREGTSNAAIMHGVAQTLSDEDIQALSAYIAAQ